MITSKGSRQIQSAFLVSGKATYLTQPDEQQGYGHDLIGHWYAVPSKASFRETIPRCNLNLLPAGNRCYSSGQEKDAIWHYARAGWATSRSTFHTLYAAVHLRLPLNREYSKLLRFLGFSSYLPPPPCHLTAAEVKGLTKDRLATEFHHYGGKFSKAISSMSVAQMKQEFIEFLQQGYHSPDSMTAWKTISPILLSSMILKPLDADKVTSLRKGIENELKVLEKFKASLAGFQAFPGADVEGPFKLGLASGIEAQNYHLATSVDGIIFIDGRPYLMEIKTATTHATQSELRSEVAKDLQDHEMRAFSSCTSGPLSIEDLPDSSEFQVPSSDAAAFKQAVKSIQHRYQLLHHAAVLGIDDVLYIQADLEGVRRIKHVRFTEEIRSLYLKYFKKLFKFIGYYEFSSNIVDYPTTQASQEAANKISPLIEKFSYCRDAFTLGQYFAIGKLLRSQPEIPKSCYRIKPAASHVWCSRKPASDCGSQAKKTISSQFHIGTASYMVIRTLDTIALNFWKTERFRLQTFRSFLLDTAEDIVDAYRIKETSNSSSSSSPSPSHSSLVSPPTTPGKFDQIPALIIPQYVSDAWPIFAAHLPVFYRDGRNSWQSFYCGVPKCKGRIRHYCPTCKMALCFFRPKCDSSICWLQHHEKLFTGRARELYREYLASARYSVKRTLSEMSEESSIGQESELGDDQTESDLD